MLSFPNAKINIGLNITEKRTDGYHNIESVFYPIPLKDALEIVESDKLQFTNSGLLIDSKPEDNLCIKAYNILKNDFNIPYVHIHLHKIIPFGAGLGGGSADASFTITMLNQMFSLGLKNNQLEEYALKIGSDCPFFIQNTPKYVTGRGEIFEEINFDLKNKFFVLINPGIHIGTKDAYSGVIPSKSTFNLKSINCNTINTWKNFVKNDFENSVFNLHPEILNIKEFLYQNGAIYASMSGSGSSVFGIFETKPQTEIKFKDYFTFQDYL